MEKVLVKASGLNSRPSWDSSVNTGRNDTVMTKSEKNSAGPTSTAASISVAARDAPGGACSSRLWAFSIMTIEASTMAPTAMAMPPRLMMLEVIPIVFMIITAIITPIGRVMMATSALRTWSRKTMQTSATMTLSSISVRFRLSTARRIRSERS